MVQWSRIIFKVERVFICEKAMTPSFIARITWSDGHQPTFGGNFPLTCPNPRLLLITALFFCKSRLQDQEQKHNRITHLFFRRQSPFQKDLMLKKMVVNVPIVMPIPLLVFDSIDIANLWNPFRIRIIMGKFGCTQIRTSSSCSSEKKKGFSNLFLGFGIFCPEV